MNMHNLRAQILAARQQCRDTLRPRLLHSRMNIIGEGLQRLAASAISGLFAGASTSFQNLESMMMKSIQWLFAAILTLGFTAPALCEERATKEEAKTMVDAAYDHIKKVGAEQAFKDFNTDKAKWTKKDLYVMAYDAQAVCLANGANQSLVGKNMKDLKDANGVPIVMSLLDKAARGGGWVEYQWAHPQTRKTEGKTTFARQLPDGTGFIGVGVYR